MNKYIDAEKLKAEIERKKVPFKKDIEDNVCPTYLCALMDFEDLINSLQQEQPSLPDNLDEAAKEYMKKARKHLFDDSPIGRADDAFKAGAKWMAGQGLISEGIIYQTSGEDTTIELNEHIVHLEDCEKVIVNIRKKEENHD